MLSHSSIHLQKVANVSGCTNFAATANYNAWANIDDGSCAFGTLGCTHPLATNYNPAANIDDGTCIPHVYGCMDDGYCVELASQVAGPFHLCAHPNGTNSYNTPAAYTGIGGANHNSTASADDGSCLYAGCTAAANGTCPQAYNYNSGATVDNGSCEWSGCSDLNAVNTTYIDTSCGFGAPLWIPATVDDGTCCYVAGQTWTGALPIPFGAGGGSCQ